MTDKKERTRLMWEVGDILDYCQQSCKYAKSSTLKHCEGCPQYESLQAIRKVLDPQHQRTKPRVWTDDELQFIEDNYEKNVFDCDSE